MVDVLVPLGQAFWLWTALNLAALIASLLLLLRGAGLPVWTALALAALAALEAPRALMIEAPRCCTDEMKSPFSQPSSVMTCVAGRPLTFAL